MSYVEIRFAADHRFHLICNTILMEDKIAKGKVEKKNWFLDIRQFRLYPFTIGSLDISPPLFHLGCKTLICNRVAGRYGRKIIYIYR